jgi:hypothetical protein
VQSAAVAVLSGMLIVAVSAAVLGRKTGPGDLWQRTKGRVPALLGLVILTGLILLVGVLALAAPGTLVLVLVRSTAGAVTGGILLGLGLLVGVVGATALYVAWWSCAAPALLLENQGIVASLRRSMRLVRRSFWRVLGIQLLTLLLAGIASELIAAPFGIVSAGVPLVLDVDPYSSFGVVLVTTTIASLGTVVSGAIISPFQAAVTALLYIDLRMRREGLDLELARAAAVDSPR